MAVAAVELVGTVAAPASQGGTASAPVSVSVGTHAAGPAVVDTHGDLVVTSGQKVYLPNSRPPPIPTTYYQGGNITVESGGTLIVQNITLSFVQFVADTGIPAARLHVFKFVVDAGGAVVVYNSTITTDPSVLNPYVKLQIVDNGVLTFWHSSVETAGAITVGATGRLTLNASSSLGPNLALGNDVSASKLVQGDVVFAPTLSVTGGGSANLFASAYRGLYADNFSANGAPNPLPLSSPGTVTVATGTNWSSFTTPIDTLSLTQDYLYPSGIGGGNLTINYTDTSGTSTVAAVTVWYGGTAFPLGSATFSADVTSSASLLFSPALTAAINAGGMMGWLNRTGDFGLPSGISVAFQITTGPNVPGTSLAFGLAAPVAFGPSVSGAGSTLSTVDSYLGLDFTAHSAAQGQKHQLNLTDGASAYLGNLSVEGTLANGTSQYANNAIVADATSNAYLFRWAYLAVVGNKPALLVVNATVMTPYAYGVTQLNNATAQAANAFQTSDPAIWGYLQSWDAAHGVAAYRESATDGVASVLLASNWINASSAPDGNYLGDYHVVVTPPAGSGSAQSFNASVPPYPLAVANGSAGYGLPTAWGQVSFSGYYASVAISLHNGVVVTADTTVTTTIPIGQMLGVAVNITDIGTAPITSLNGTLYYNSASKIVLAAVSKAVDLKVPGQNATLKLTWLVNDTVVGVLGNPVNDTLSVFLVWNDNVTSKGGGTLSTSKPVRFVPSMAISSTNGVIVTADGAKQTTMRIGQVLSLAINLTDNSSVPITYLQGTLYYTVAAKTVLASLAETVDLVSPGQNITVRLNWKVNDSVVGLAGGPVNDNLSLSIVWNQALVSEDGGFLSTIQAVRFTPSELTITDVSPLPTQLSRSDTYLTSGFVTYNGSHEVPVTLVATPVGGGSPVTLGVQYVGPAGVEGAKVSFDINWPASELSAGKSYVLNVTATYNSVVASYPYPDHYSVPSPAPTSFFTEKFLGLELWLWIVIAAAIVAAALGFLLFSRRQAVGKLVECGECGNLVPEDAKVCPKCGAEFESDVVRCSRCSSTIPASSKFCPECAAQLLGKPGEGGLDPERQAYGDFTERFRAEGKKDLGDNYSESAFWDWWKRQPSYTPFSQWKIQQGQGTPRVGTTAPPPPGSPPTGGAPPAAPAPRRAATPPPARRPPSSAAPAAPVAAPAPAPVPTPAPGALKPCPNCRKEIPPEYLVCPFCGSVTQ